jgi:archaellum component FlaC
MQDELSAKSNSLSEAASKIERLSQEITRLDQLCIEKSNESLSLAGDLENAKKSFEELQVRICDILSLFQAVISAETLA